MLKTYRKAQKISPNFVIGRLDARDSNAKPQSTLTKQVRLSIQSFQKIRLPLKFFLVLVAISLFSIYSFASNATVTTNNVQSVNGVLFFADGGFTVESKGFFVAHKTSASSEQPTQWLDGGNCQTQLTAGNWYYFATLTITAKAQPNHTYTITVMANNDSGYATLGVLSATSPSTITPGQTMNLYFDTEMQNLSDDMAVTITVI